MKIICKPAEHIVSYLDDQKHFVVHVPEVAGDGIAAVFDVDQRLFFFEFVLALEADYFETAIEIQWQVCCSNHKN